jgi:hypothetical protein
VAQFIQHHLGIQKCFKFSNDSVSISLTNVLFRFVLFVRCQPQTGLLLETTCNDMEKANINKSFVINKPHNIFGHCGFETLRSIGKIHNLTRFETRKFVKNVLSQRQSKTASIKFG